MAVYKQWLQNINNLLVSETGINDISNLQLSWYKLTKDIENCSW